jgi:hypothetical protein
VTRWRIHIRKEKKKLLRNARVVWENPFLKSNYFWHSTLVKITLSTLPEGDIKTFLQYNKSISGTQDKLTGEHLEMLEVMVRR